LITPSTVTNSRGRVIAAPSVSWANARAHGFAVQREERLPWIDVELISKRAKA
jgi:hypothetical protein